MAGLKLLLPYNFTRQDQKALDFIVDTFAKLRDTEITIFHGYTAVPEITPRQNPVMEKIQGNLNYLQQMIKDKETSLETVREDLVRRGFPSGRIHLIFKPCRRDIAVEIADLARDRTVDVVVISRKPGKVTRFFTGSVFSKVVSGLKDTTVCIVS